MILTTAEKLHCRTPFAEQTFAKQLLVEHLSIATSIKLQIIQLIFTRPLIDHQKFLNEKSVTNGRVTLINLIYGYTVQITKIFVHLTATWLEPSTTQFVNEHSTIQSISVFVYQLSGCGFESCCCHLNFRYDASFEKEVPSYSDKLQRVNSL